MNNLIFNEKGGTILTVVILTTAVSILLSVLLATQYHAPHPKKIQSLANARAVLIKELNKKPLEKSFSAIKADTLDTLPLWKNLKFGDGFIEQEASPFSLTYHALGHYKNDTSHLTVSCGASLTLSDTTLVIFNRDEIEGKELVSGTIVQKDSSTMPKQFTLDSKALSESKKATDSLFVDLDTLTPSATISIFQTSDFNAMGNTIGGDLFIDGTDITISGREQLYTIKGDLQLTGAVKIKSTTFIVGGEVRINDQSELKDVTIFVKGNLFLSHESQFSGRIISYGSIEILDNSTILEKSLILSMKKAKSGKASLYVRGNAKVDGTLFSRGALFTFETTETKGILYSMSNILHKGYHSGIIIANSLGNQAPKNSTEEKKTTPQKETMKPSLAQNKIEGTVTDVFEKPEYPLPWFIGEKKVVSWREKR